MTTWKRPGHVVPKSVAFVSRVIRHPSWARAHVYNLIDKRYDGVLAAWPGPSSTVGAVEAVACLGGVDQQTASAAVEELPGLEPGAASSLYGAPDASTALLEVLYGYCRVTRPETVLEIGVAHGYTSAAVLRALEANGSGCLYSIDLPHLHPRAERDIGRAVGRELRPRWTLVLGPSDEWIPRLVRQLASPVDVAVHDGAHTLRGQLADYQRLWSCIKPGGVLISDDAGPAATLMGQIAQTDGLYVDQAPKARPIAIFVKPRADHAQAGK